MAKVKLLTAMAGVNFSHNAGDEIELTDDQALRYVAAGIAEIVTPAIEKAVKKPALRKATKG